MLDNRRFAVARETVDFIYINSHLKHALCVNPEYEWMHSLMQRNQAVYKESHVSDDFGHVDQSCCRG